MIRVAVRVHPGASRDAVALREDGGLDVRVRARPVEGKADDALIELLADRLGLRARDVRLVRGDRARQKLVEVDLATAAELRGRLESGS